MRAVVNHHTSQPGPPLVLTGAFMHSFLSISHICLNIGLEFDCEMCPAIADLDHTQTHTQTHRDTHTQGHIRHESEEVALVLVI